MRPSASSNTAYTSKKSFKLAKHAGAAPNDRRPAILDVGPSQEAESETITRPPPHRRNYRRQRAHRTRSSQKATALAAATFRESTSCAMGIFTV